MNEYKIILREEETGFIVSFKTIKRDCVKSKEDQVAVLDQLGVQSDDFDVEIQEAEDCIVRTLFLLDEGLEYKGNRVSVEIIEEI